MKDKKNSSNIPDQSFVTTIHKILSQRNGN